VQVTISQLDTVQFRKARVPQKSYVAYVEIEVAVGTPRGHDNKADVISSYRLACVCRECFSIYRV